jgi:hypothetical protein
VSKRHGNCTRRGQYNLKGKVNRYCIPIGVERIDCNKNDDFCLPNSSDITPLYINNSNMI